MSLRLHGDTIATAGMADFAVNVWPERPESLTSTLESALAATDRYPDERAAREAIARRHGRSVDEVLLLNGACEAFWLIAHAYRPVSAACIHPGFTEPEAALRATGAEIARVFLEPERWSLEPEQVPDGPEIVVVGNPNNPTGTLEQPETITRLARPDRLLVVDESFVDFVPDESASLAGDRETPGLVVVRSLTKLWSLPGIRAGYLLAAPPVVERLSALRQPWSVNSLACAALVTCAGDRHTPRAVVERVAEARAELVEALRAFGSLRVWPSAANFLLVREPDRPHLREQLARHGVAVRPASSFPGLDDTYLRIAVRRPHENAILVRALDEILA